MALVIDNRGTVAEPGIHALIVGVSDYLNLPDHDDPPINSAWFLNKLTSPALSAFKFYELVRTSPLRLPIKTVRLLLSPSQLEVNVNPALGTSGATRANRAAFEMFARDWRADAGKNPADMTIFYFSGHGMQRGPEEGVLVLEDFLAVGPPPLSKCFTIGDIRNGMAPSLTFPNIALTQFYFIDACLTRPDMLNRFIAPQVPDVFGAELNSADRRQAPMMFSTVDGAIALGRKGKPSHFAEALMLALGRAAEDPVVLNGTTVWPITCLTIKTALDAYYNKNNVGTEVKIGGVVGSPVIRYLPGPPDVDISVQVQPDNLGNPRGVCLYDESDTAMAHCNPHNNAQFETTVKAGIYWVQVDRRFFGLLRTSRKCNL